MTLLIISVNTISILQMPLYGHTDSANHVNSNKIITPVFVVTDLPLLLLLLLLLTFTVH